MATISVLSNNRKQNLSPDNLYPVPVIKKSHIPLPQALLPSKFLQHPSGLDSVLHATTNPPPTTGFHAKYGLKPPSLLDGVFQEYVHPQTVQAVKPTKSPFKSIIKVPSALDLYGDFSVNSNEKRNQPPSSENHILSLEVPPMILTNIDSQPTTFSKMDIHQRQKMYPNQDDELTALHKENALLNSLIRKLIIEEVENIGPTEQIDEKHHTHDYKHEKHHTHDYKDENHHKNNKYYPKVSQVELLVAAVKDNPDLLTRIQGLRNLKSG